MKININRIPTEFSGETCFTHARGVITPDGKGLITTQPLRLSGSDIFYGMYLMHSEDGGASWTAPTPSATLIRQPAGGGLECGICDATPMYHGKTGKILLIGYMKYYKEDADAPYGTPNATAYSVYDPEASDFGELCTLRLPDGIGGDYFYAANGCGQCVELPDGDILVPIYHGPLSRDLHFSTSVVRCRFDGRRLEAVELGESIRCDDARGVYEGSLVSYGGRCYLCMRNDLCGYVAAGDGLRFEEKRPLTFDDGEELGSYNTQQHWLAADDGLYIVYTRRCADNDHIFRHRAPLFVAKFDTERMCVIRSTEQIAVPERGARLGNFGCAAIDGRRGLVIASEWMQSTPPDWQNWKKCAAYGSDNSIFVSEVIYGGEDDG